MRNKWLLAIRSYFPSFVPRKSSSICEFHFEEHDYYNSICSDTNSKKILHHTAVPSIFYGIGKVLLNLFFNY